MYWYVCVCVCQCDTCDPFIWIKWSSLVCMVMEQWTSFPKVHIFPQQASLCYFIFLCVHIHVLMWTPCVHVVYLWFCASSWLFIIFFWRTFFQYPFFILVFSTWQNELYFKLHLQRYGNSPFWLIFPAWQNKRLFFIQESNLIISSILCC